MSKFLVLILVVTSLVGVSRFIVPISGLDAEDIYKDMAHLWVGFLFGAAVYCPWKLRNSYDCYNSDGDEKVFLWVFALGLTAIEVIAFLVRS